MKYDLNCGACIRAHLAENGIPCVSLESAIGGFLTGKDVHDRGCKADPTTETAPTNERNEP